MEITRDNASTIAENILNGSISFESDIANQLKIWFKTRKEKRDDKVLLSWDKKLAQDLLDQGYPINYIFEKVGLDSNIPIYRAIDNGKLSTDKRKKLGYQLKSRPIYAYSKYGCLVARGTIVELSKELNMTERYLNTAMYRQRNSDASIVKVGWKFVRVPTKQGV